MIISAEEFVRLRTSQNPEEYNQAAHDSASDEIWLEVIENYPDMRKWVAHNKTISNRIIEVLASDAGDHVRFRK